MTASEIREMKIVAASAYSGATGEIIGDGSAVFLREIAAQLSELNEKLATVITQDGEGGAQYVRTALYTHTPVRKK